jgi:hypothetical protein
MWPDRIIPNSDLYPRELLVVIVNRLGRIKHKLKEVFQDSFCLDFDDFHPGMADEDIELPMGKNRQSNDNTLEGSQLGRTKRKLDQTGFAEKNRRESNA